MRFPARRSLLVPFPLNIHLFPKFHNSQERVQSSISSAANNRVRQRLQRKSKDVPAQAQITSLPDLSVMPTRLLLRSFMITSLLASPRLLNVCLPIMTYVAKSKSALLNPDQNRLLGVLMRALFYNHFCAGKNDAEVKKTVTTMKSMGFKGVILGYAREIIVDPAASREEAAASGLAEPKDNAIDEWREGNLRTLPMIGSGDFLAIKFTGAGPAATKALALGQTPPPQLWQSIVQICDAAAQQNTRVWIDAEQQVFQSTIDAWAIDLMRRYNRHGVTRVYTTFQAYLKSTPSRIAQHLDLAKKEDWVLGIKLVRGAYIASEPRHLIHDTKAATDNAYNSIVQDLLMRTFPSIPLDAFPQVQLMLASHNKDSVQKAYCLHRARILAGEPTIELEFGQLQGMADEVSCGLLKLCYGKGTDREVAGVDPHLVEAVAPKAYKCLAWGSTQECMQFLVRRAIENRGSMDRTYGWVLGLRKELWRRMRGVIRVPKSMAH